MVTLSLFLIVLADAKPDADAIAAGLASKEDTVVLNALTAAVEDQSPSLASPLCKLLKHRNPAVRQAAIEVLGGRTEKRARSKAAGALCARLGPLVDKHEENGEELDKLLTALHDLAQEKSIKPLLGLKSTAPREIREKAAMAVANVPDKEAIERLIQYGYKDRRGSGRTRDIAVKALRYATQEKLRGGIEAWRQWWKENEDTFDFEAAAKARAEARGKAEEKRERRKKRKPRD